LIKFRIRNRARIWMNLVASGAFIALAIYGWDLPVETAIAFLVICIVFLLAIVALGIVAGWLLRKLRQLRGADDDSWGNTDGRE
jgi:NhaP-type Na+/H+ or K+/H+ antiporter